jgi:hypothetical protein
VAPPDAQDIIPSRQDIKRGLNSPQGRVLARRGRDDRRVMIHPPAGYDDETVSSISSFMNLKNSPTDAIIRRARAASIADARSPRAGATHPRVAMAQRMGHLVEKRRMSVVSSPQAPPPRR